MTALSSLMTFAGNPLDRAHLKRLDPAWLTAARQDPRARVLALSTGKALLSLGEDQHYRAVWLSPEEIGATTGRAVFLGLDAGAPCFALDIGESEEAFAARGSFVDPRLALFTLPAREAAMVAEARALLLWHARHRFCANCGAPSESVEGGWKRRCGACEAEHFPRTDPVVIMCAARGGKVLLGRKGMFPPGWYTALAGFVEPGETIEEAVAREVFEEAGIRTGAVRYLASQPWPYPSQLMIGCLAAALSEDIAIDGHELEDARWFTRDEVRAALNQTEGALRIPPPFAIAHHLIRHWAEQG